MPRIWRLSTLLCLLLTAFSGPAADRPALSDAQAWFAAARAWLDASGQIPATSDALSHLAPQVAGMRCFAVGVVLRLDGRVVGESWRRAGDAQAVRSALQEALDRAQNHRSILALPEDLRALLGRRLSLEMDFAGDPVPLVGDRMDLLALRVEPCLQALGIRNGDRWVVAMPSLVQAHDQGGVMNYLALTMAREVGLDPAASKDLKLPDGAAMYRMSTRRLAQRSPDAPPFESVRGKPLVPIASIHAEAARTMADELAQHLLARWPTTDGLPPEAAQTVQALGPRAAYRPLLDEWPRPDSPPADQALAALAMAEYAGQSWAAENARGAARRFAIDTIASLRNVQTPEADPMADMAACAAILRAADALDRQDRGWTDQGGRAWLRSVRQALQAMPPGSAPTAALACAALGADAGDALRDAAWKPESAERVVMSSAWMLADDRTPPPDAAKAWAAALVPLAETQFAASVDGAAAPDLDGGWSSGATQPWPTAQSSRAALGLATALQRSDIMSPDQRAQAVRTLRGALRFLRQLQFDADACHACRAPRRALGGLRASAWEGDEPLAASAYALLAAMRAADSLGSASVGAPGAKP